MQRSMLFVLGALVALVLGVHRIDPGSSVAPALDPGASVRLTAQETDCIVGGQEGCVAAFQGAMDDCLANKASSGDLEGTADVIECVTVGAYTAVACAITWFFSLFW